MLETRDTTICIRNDEIYFFNLKLFIRNCGIYWDSQNSVSLEFYFNEVSDLFTRKIKSLV